MSIQKMPKIVLEGYIVVAKESIDSVAAELPNHIKLTLSEPGCCAFEVTERTNETCIFDVYEEFIDQASFEYHQLRMKGTKWADVTTDAKRHYSITRRNL